jgi:hypothetical protein
VGGVGRVGRALLTTATATVAACGANPTSPTPTPVGYEGRWTGSAFTGAVPFGTSLAGAFSFTVSRDQKITAIEFDYRLNACGGKVSVANLNLPLFEYQQLGTSFEYRSTDFTQPNYVSVFGTFKPDGTAEGIISLGQYQGCGDGGGFWTARR